jgi:phosphoribosylglycinamide formyltransferase-1
MWGHHVHEAVIAAGETESGATVHFVSEHIDAGAIVMQGRVEVTPQDTPETLEAKVHAVEYDIYPRAILQVLNDCC